MKIRRLIPYVAVAAMAYGLYWLVIGRFNPTPPAPDYPAPRSSAEAHAQDLDYLGVLPKLDNSFSPASAAEFEKRRLSMLEQTGSMSVAQFAMGVSELVALADNGHTNVSPGRRARLLNRVPLRFAWFAEGLFVIRSDAAHRDLLGARVTAIGGHPIAEIEHALRRFRGDTPQRARLRNLYVLESPEALAVVYPDVSSEHLSLEVGLADGSVVQHDVIARPADPEMPLIAHHLLLSPAAAKADDPNGVSLLAEDAPLPLVLRGNGASLFRQDLDNGAALYLHLWSMQDDAAGGISSQLSRLLEAQPAPWKYVIVDLRNNGGGDYTKLHAFARNLPAHLNKDGRLYVLTNAETFSAALVTAAFLKHYGGDRAIIVGEPVGDRTAFWAEGGSLVLPNSKLPIGFATGYHDWENGCDDLRRCFSLNFWFGVAAGKLDPSIDVAWTFADYREGRDSVLDAALAHARSGPSTQND